MNTREGLATILAETINLAVNFEAATEPVGGFVTGFHNIFNNSLASQTFADEVDKVFTSHGITMEKVISSLRTANDHIHNTYQRTTYLGAAEGPKEIGDGHLDPNKKSRPDLPNDQPEIGKQRHNPIRPDGSFIDPPAHDNGKGPGPTPSPQVSPAKMEPYKASQRQNK